MVRAGLYRPVHVKTLRSQKLRMLLTHRKLLRSKAIAIENDLRGTLRNFGLKVGMVGKVKFESRIKELVDNLPDLVLLVEPLLIVRPALREQTCAASHALRKGFEHPEASRAHDHQSPSIHPVRRVRTTTRAAIRCWVPRSCATQNSKTASLPRPAHCCQGFRAKTIDARSWSPSGRIGSPIYLFT
jgi:transposase